MVNGRQKEEGREAERMVIKEKGKIAKKDGRGVIRDKE